MTGSLHEKNGKWQLVLYGAVEILFPDKKTENPRKKVCKWVSSNLSATSKNRLLASKMLVEKIMEYEQQENLAAERKALIDNGIIVPTLSVTTDILFTDFVEDWLKRKQGQIQQTTWEKYQIYAERHIIPYFAELNVKLSELKPRHFVDYYQYKSTGGRLDGKEGGLDITSVRGHAALIRTILNEAVIFEYINGNPAQNVAVPKRARTNAKSAKNVYMTATEANNMLKAIENEDIFPLVYVAITYRLRKSEVLGLKWDAVDFEKNTLEIKSTVVKNKTIVYKDTTKTESSHETYELLPEITELLIAIKAEQDRNRKEYEELYTQTDYIFTQPDGRLYRPDSITRTFQRTLKRHGLPEMRFHDLRHSTASILFDKGWDLEAVKAWLRHADVETTSNIYLHVSKDRKHLLAADMHGTFIAPIVENNNDTETGEKKDA